MAGVIGSLAFSVAVPDGRADFPPAAAAAMVFGLASVLLATCSAVATLVDEGYTNDAMAGFRVICMHAESVGAVHVLKNESHADTLKKADAFQHHLAMTYGFK